MKGQAFTVSCAEPKKHWEVIPNFLLGTVGVVKRSAIIVHLLSQSSRLEPLLFRQHCSFSELGVIISVDSLTKEGMIAWAYSASRFLGDEICHR
jgi:hypothetical protein